MSEPAAAENPVEPEVTKPAVKVPARPHMPKAAVEFLDEQLKASKCFLEYGAGGSTRLAMRNKVPVIYSVESDPDFAHAMRRIIKREKGESQVKITVPPIGPTKIWGYPENKESVGKWPIYPLGIWDTIAAAGHMPDLALVDGRFRLACTLTCLLKMKPGSTIIFDDYVGRERRYKDIESIIEPVALKDRTAVFTVPADLPVHDVAILLAKSVVRAE